MLKSPVVWKSRKKKHIIYFSIIIVRYYVCIYIIKFIKHPFFSFFSLFFLVGGRPSEGGGDDDWVWVVLQEPTWYGPSSCGSYINYIGTGPRNFNYETTTGPKTKWRGTSFWGSLHFLGRIVLQVGGNPWMSIGNSIWPQFSMTCHKMFCGPIWRP